LSLDEQMYFLHIFLLVAVVDVFNYFCEVIVALI